MSIQTESGRRFLPPSQLPWRRRSDTTPPGSQWLTAGRLCQLIDAWHVWLDEHSGEPGKMWLLPERDPEIFCSALLALWESGRSAMIPANSRPQTLALLEREVVGTIPPQLPARSASWVPRETPAALNPQAPAVVLFTSGSTGQPCRISKRFNQLDAELAVQASLWPLDGGGVISQVSYCHIYGLLVGFLRPLCHGLPFCHRDCEYPEVLLARLHDAQASNLRVSVASSPAQLCRLPRHLEWATGGVPRQIFCSGAPLDKAQALAVESLLECPVTEIYGSTETGGIGYRRQCENESWTPLPGVEISIEYAMLSLRSPFLEAPRQWWHQPDRAVIDDTGFVLLGRADRIAKVGGKRVSLQGLEQSLTALDIVQGVRCCELGRADGRLGAIVELDSAALPHNRDARKSLVSRMRGALIERFPELVIPRYWRFVDRLPRNSQGKMDQTLIQRLFADLDDSSIPRWLGDAYPMLGKVVLTLEVPERLRYLDGHFERFPLVPGVVLIQWAFQLAETYLGAIGEFHAVEKVKFQQPLLPGARFTLHMEERADRIAFRIVSALGQHCSGQLQTRHAEGHA